MYVHIRMYDTYVIHMYIIHTYDTHAQYNQNICFAIQPKFQIAGEFGV